MERVEALAGDLDARPGRRRAAPPGARRAAVAVILAPGEDGRARLLYIRRSEQEGDPWSGHMAFPGGRVDPGDADPRAAAVRETWEEVGLDLSGARWLGRLDERVTPRRAGPARLVITPHVFALDALPALRTNGEVAATHWFALDRLLAGEGRGTRTWRWRGVPVVLPAVRLDGTEIWGLTLRITDELLERLRRATR